MEFTDLLRTNEAMEALEATIEIKIKTLDSQTHSLRVNKEVPVPLLKEQIAEITGIASEQQRLICRGKVLKDDELLSTYHVEDGHTLHLVVRQPQVASSASHMRQDTANLPDYNPSTDHGNGNSISGSIVFEAINLGESNNLMSSLNEIISSISGSGQLTNASGQHVLDRQSSFESVPLLPPQTPSGPGLFFPSVEPDTQQVFPDSLTTISNYVDLLRDEFRISGLNGVAPLHSGHDNQSHVAPRQRGLPSPTALAEVMRSTQQLALQASECLSLISADLLGHGSVTESSMRAAIQSRALRGGSLLMNFGSLLLELGRTTLMLRLGQNPSEAVVNAGPAVFISSSRPNPLMVQPLPFPGTSIGSIGGLFPSNGLQAPVSVGEQVGSQQAQDHRASSQPNQSPHGFSVGMGSGPFGGLFPMRSVSPVPNLSSASVPLDSPRTGFAVTPVVARIEVHRVNDSGTRGLRFPVQSFQAGSSVNQQSNSESMPAAGNSEASGGTNAQHANSEAAHVSATAIPSEASQDERVDGNSSNSSLPSGSQAAQDTLSHMLARLGPIGQFVRSILTQDQVGITGGRSQETAEGSAVQVDSIRNPEPSEPSVVSDEALQFSNLVRQLMPFILEHASAHGTESASAPPSTPHLNNRREDMNGSTSSQHCRDPSDDPVSKRQRKE